MSILAIIQLSLVLLQSALSVINKPGVELPAELVADLQAAIAATQKVAGSDVTQAQLESFKLTTLW